MGEYTMEASLKDFTQDERKHLIDMFWALKAKRSMTPLARKELQEVPGPSLASSLGQMRGLVERFRGMGDLRAVLVQTMSWENPAQTVTAMLLYTMVCYRPNLLACIPLLSIIIGTFIPNYARKFLYSEGHISSLSHHLETIEEKEIEELIVDRRQEAAERDIIKGLRSAQASLSKISESLDKLDKFKAGPGNFEDPKASCALFLVMVLGTINVAYLTSFVDIKQLFASSGLLIFILANPKVKAYLAALEPVNIKLTLVSRIVGRISSQFEFDDPPVLRTVEIFELQRQGLTPRMWDTLLFTPVIYSITSPYRLSHRFPPGSDSLVDVACPNDWAFTGDGVWVEDPSSSSWIQERRIDGVVPDGAWAVDTNSEFRRRRLVRVCYYDPK